MRDQRLPIQATETERASVASLRAGALAEIAAVLLDVRFGRVCAGTEARAARALSALGIDADPIGFGAIEACNIGALGPQGGNCR